jgi:DNA-directed RNA polymerase specialized sigma24 family protein
MIDILNTLELVYFSLTVLSIPIKELYFFGTDGILNTNQGENLWEVMRMKQEQQVIAQLNAYKRLKARKKQLEGTSVGPGVRLSAVSEDDHLQELHRQLRKLPSYMYLDEHKVLEARTGSNGFEGYMGVIDKISELQDIEKQLQAVDQALEALEAYEPEYARLLKMRFIEGKPTEFVASELGIVDRTFRRWKQKALAEVVRFLSG